MMGSVEGRTCRFLPGLLVALRQQMLLCLVTAMPLLMGRVLTMVAAQRCKLKPFAVTVFLGGVQVLLLRVLIAP